MRNTVAKRIRREAYGKEGYSGPKGRTKIKVNPKLKRIPTNDPRNNTGKDILCTVTTTVNRGPRLLYQLMKRNYMAGIKQ
jgi:hypothetical protein